MTMKPLATAFGIALAAYCLLPVVGCAAADPGSPVNDSEPAELTTLPGTDWCKGELLCSDNAPFGYPNSSRPEMLRTSGACSFGSYSLGEHSELLEDGKSVGTYYREQYAFMFCFADTGNCVSCTAGTGHGFKTRTGKCAGYRSCIGLVPGDCGYNGCYYSAYSDTCSGNPTACDTYSNPEWCGEHTGCYWDTSDD
jgi:hypothetical protein